MNKLISKRKITTLLLASLFLSFNTSAQITFTGNQLKKEITNTSNLDFNTVDLGVKFLEAKAHSFNYIFNNEREK